MRTDAPLGIAAVDVPTNGQPEGFTIAEMASESMPLQSWILTAQSREGRRGESAPLVVRLGVWLLHPAQSAAAAELVIDGECLLAVQVRRPLTPAGTVG